MSKVETSFPRFFFSHSTLSAHAVFIGLLKAVWKRFQHLEHEEALERNSIAQEHYQKIMWQLTHTNLHSLIHLLISPLLLYSDLVLLGQVSKTKKHREENPWNLRLRTKPMTKGTTINYIQYLSWSLQGEPTESFWARVPGHFTRPVWMPGLILSIMPEQRKDLWP